MYLVNILKSIHMMFFKIFLLRVFAFLYAFALVLLLFIYFCVYYNTNFMNKRYEHCFYEDKTLLFIKTECCFVNLEHRMCSTK